MATMKYRTLETTAAFQTREENDALYIEGYFSVFNSLYHIWPGATESVAPGAFTETIANDDIRALINHDTTLVLGRNTAGTLELREDDHGLWGRITINPKDTDAMNQHARVQRGDVSQCSIGFEILAEETEYPDEDSVHYTIRKVKLYEVSVCTFPAYEETSVSARSKDLDAWNERKSKAWKDRMRKKMRG